MVCDRKKRLYDVWGCKGNEVVIVNGLKRCKESDY